jgi:hypothetical protein
MVGVIAINMTATRWWQRGYFSYYINVLKQQPYEGSGTYSVVTVNVFKQRPGGGREDIFKHPGGGQHGNLGNSPLFSSILGKCNNYI